MQIYDFLSQKPRNAACSLQFGYLYAFVYVEAAEVIRERIQKRALSVHNETERHVFYLLSGKVYSHSIVEGGFEEMS